MAAVLGISAYYHDAAAALVVDGEIRAAMQEERFSRIKNDPQLPRQAIAACLKEAGLTAAQLDAVVFYENPYAKLERVLMSLLRGFPFSFRQFGRALGAQLGQKLWVVDQLAELLNIERRKISFLDHHESHAASAFFTSPFAEAAVLTVDGVGEEISTAIWHGQGCTLRRDRAISFPHSLGLLYAALTSFLGFRVNEGEYKVMGLAAFGTPRFAAEFARLLLREPDGSFALALRYFDHTGEATLGFSPRLAELLGAPRPPERPWDLEQAEDRRYADIAASLQQATEEALLALAKEAQRITGARALCLAGGVALNAVANGRLLAESGFDRIYVQPAAGDAGGALGAAIVGALRLGDPRPRPLTSAALGTRVSADDAEPLAGGLGFATRRVDSPAKAVATLLAADQIVALVDGRFEWGPRALGQRSILALPTRATVRERLNRVIKQREPFRPFAPVVTSARAADYFIGAPNDMTPFMTTVCAVRPERRDELAAVTHVDGSARVQTVEATSPLGAILSELDAATGVPVALNTSLNGPGEPIVADVTQALAFFMRHSIDAMLIGDVMITRGRTG